MVDFLELLQSSKSNLPNKFTIALGELIKKARNESNLSQKELANLVYLNQASISQIEWGKRSVTAEEIVYLCNALNKPIQYFFSMDFLYPVNENSLSILEQKLLMLVRKLSTDDIRRIIIQVKALVEMDR
ncbi:MAG: helix-turn-helix domain-containing protein [Candidatus Hodarchaeales archaeon]